MDNMISEEKFIVEKFGRREPFRVPDGYFDDFASQMMERLPDDTSQPVATFVSIRRRGRRWFKYVTISAASVCTAIVCAGVFLHVGRHNESKPSIGLVYERSAVSSYTAVDAVADYAMYDTDDMYVYLQDDNY